MAGQIVSTNYDTTWEVHCPCCNRKTLCSVGDECKTTSPCIHRAVCQECHHRFAVYGASRSYYDTHHGNSCGPFTSNHKEAWEALEARLSDPRRLEALKKIPPGSIMGYVHFPINCPLPVVHSDFTFPKKEDRSAKTT